MHVVTSTYGYLLRYHDGTWVDEAAAIFASAKDKDFTPLKTVLKELFSLHRDVYALLFSFLLRAGKQRQTKESLPRICLDVFQEWLKEQREEGEEIR